MKNNIILERRVSFKLGKNFESAGCYYITV